MSIQVAPPQAAEAAQQVILGLALLITDLVDHHAGAKVAGFNEDEFLKWTRSTDRERSPLGMPAQPAIAVLHAERLARYAWQGTWDGSPSDLDDAITEFLVLEPFFGRSTAPQLHNAFGEPIVPESAIDTLQAVLSASHARRALDNDDAGLLTVFGLAALAGVAEKTIRMAANPKNERPLRTTKAGTATLIEAEDARDWLSRRTDFAPTEYFVTDWRNQAIGDIPTLSRASRYWRDYRGWSVETLAVELGWSAEQVGFYSSIEDGKVTADHCPFQPRDFLRFAQKTEMSEPASFAEQAYYLIAGEVAGNLINAQVMGTRR